jgi:hypothetical protein
VHQTVFRSRLLTPRGASPDIVHLEHGTGFHEDRFCFHWVMRYSVNFFQVVSMVPLPRAAGLDVPGSSAQVSR